MSKKIIEVTETALPFIKEAKALLSGEEHLDLLSCIEGRLKSMQRDRTPHFLDLCVLNDWFDKLCESVDGEALDLILKAESALTWFKKRTANT